MQAVQWDVMLVSAVLEQSNKNLIRSFCEIDHDLVELFAKRSFRCDCGTLSLCRGKEDKEKVLAPCNLRSKDLKYAPENDDNKYCKNFEGQFCRCERGKTYNPEKEEEVCT